MEHITEKAYPLQSVKDNLGEYSYLRTECGNTWYSVNVNPMKRDGCICPKCGKVVKVQYDRSKRYGLLE